MQARLDVLQADGAALMAEFKSLSTKLAAAEKRLAALTSKPPQPSDGVSVGGASSSGGSGMRRGEVQIRRRVPDFGGTWGPRGK